MWKITMMPSKRCKMPPWQQAMVILSLMTMTVSAAFTELDSKTLLAPFQDYSVSDFNVIALAGFNSNQGDVEGKNTWCYAIVS